MSSSNIDNKINMYIGNDEDFELEITDDDDNPIDITSAQIIFTLKEDYTDTEAIFQRKNTFAGGGDTEIKIINAVNGLCEIYIVSDNTIDLTAGRYVYDVWVKLSSGKEKTVVSNVLTLKDTAYKPA